MKVLKNKICFDDIINNSMALFLVIVNICVDLIIYGNSNFLYTWQMFLIVGSIYLSLKFYQKYRTDTDGEKYVFLKKNHLGILFAILIVLSTLVGFIADLIMLSKF